MATAVRISDSLAQKAKQRSRVLHRSVAGQIEYWAKMGEILEENPNLTFQFVQDILIGREEAVAEDLIPYTFDD